ncbi:unnamed protein product [Adineta steineri]|uniref:GDP-fucose protein O-fucosyltransferase 2 n=1 Tax=Adineta steineri TaxID=433720 RepID=A0A818HE78_9BILA|nr:unnamed protein product [Adineta steineri]CAF3506697.1 unnamed protein product [Adineta steineri]
MVRNIALITLTILYTGMLIIIISLYQNNRSQLTSLLYQKFNSSNTISVKSSQYIWCVNHYGPNNQLKDFIKCCIIAKLNNYTIVIPPLYPHYGRRKTRSIQWFDEFYDLKQLSLVVNLITLDQFIAKFKTNKNKVMIDCYIQQAELISNRMWYPTNTLVSIQNYFKIKIDFYRYENISRNLNMKEILNKSKSCSSIFLHIHYTAFGQYFSSSNIYIQPIFQHLHRTPLIQRMASQLITLLPNLVVGKNHSQAKLSKLAVIHMRLGDYNVMSLSNYIQQILYLINSSVHFTHLHIMCPYLTSTNIKQLTDSLPIAFTTTQHLLNYVRFILDDYLYDVLEQEIAYQAPIFIASPWSTYSATVLIQKVYHKKGIVYVSSKKNNSRPLLVTEKNVKYF